MQHPTNEDDGSEADEESDDESVLNMDDDYEVNSDWESDETMELAKDEASDDGSEADEESDDESVLPSKQRQIDWLEKAMKNISEIALPIIQNKEWDRLEEIDSVWNPPPGIDAFYWKENHLLNQMIRAWRGWDDEEEGKPSEAPTEEQIAELLQDLTRLQEKFTQKFADLQKNQNFVLLP